MDRLGLLLELLLESCKAAELACLRTIPSTATVKLASIRLRKSNTATCDCIRKLALAPCQHQGKTFHYLLDLYACHTKGVQSTPRDAAQSAP